MKRKDIKKFKKLIEMCCRVAKSEGCLDTKEWVFIDETIEKLLEEVKQMRIIMKERENDKITR